MNLAKDKLADTSFRVLQIASAQQPLGYHPSDDAEEFVDRVPVRESDATEAAYVGGPMAGESFYRPALDRT